MTNGARRLIEAFPNAAIMIGAGDSVDGFNSAAAALYPMLRPEQPLSFAIRDPELLRAVSLTARDGLPRKLEVLERMPVERAFAVHVARAGEEGTLVVFDDLTAGRKLERMRVDFVANASHELRTPLASLLGFVETLRGSARDDPKAREQFLTIMEAQARRMARLIDDLLSLSRIELNAHIRPTDRVDLIGVTQQIADALKPLAAERSVQLDLVYVVPEAEVTGDRDELLRVFENLIENAIKYGASGGKVEIVVSPSGSQDFAVSVRDFGPGVSPDHLPRLTERFYRVNPVASRESGGTGLGLAIVKHIVARHRGHLDIESAPGEGSTFRVVLKKP